MKKMRLIAILSIVFALTFCSGAFAKFSGSGSSSSSGRSSFSSSNSGKSSSSGFGSSYGRSSSSSSSGFGSSIGKSSSSSGSGFGSSVGKSSSSGSSSGSTSWFGSSTGKSASSSGFGSSVNKSPAPSSSGFGSSVTKPPTDSSNPLTYGNSVKRPSDSTNPSGFGSSVKKPADTSIPSNSGNLASNKPMVQKTALQEKMDRKLSKQESAKAFASYEKEKNMYKANPSSSYNTSSQERSTVDSIRTRVRYTSRDDYYNRRNVFYETYHWSTPRYAYNTYGTFGIWDATMLWFMLDHLNDRQYAAMYYNHRNDAGMMQFRNELNRMSQDNAELRAKVAMLDSSANAMAASGTPVDPSYVPPDATDVALAATVAEKEIPVQKSSGFPWGKTFLALMVVGAIYYMFRKK